MFAHSVICPQVVCAGCKGDRVAVITSASAKTVRIAACESLQAQGWRGHQLAVTKTDVATLAAYGVLL